jgi:hypothetical protein
MSLFKEDATTPATSFLVSDSDFDDALTVGGAGQSEKIDKYDCATPDAAARLLTHFQAIGLNEGRGAIDWPMGSFVSGSPFAQSAKVPYLNFPRTPTVDDAAKIHHVNVAHILVEYTRYPSKFADTLMFQMYGPAQ